MGLTFFIEKNHNNQSYIFIKRLIMIQVLNKLSATTIYFPINIPKNGNTYVLTLKTEAYENTFTKTIEDIGSSDKYIKASVLFNDIPDGEYAYTIDATSICYSSGLINIGDYEQGEISYDVSPTFYEYDPEKGEGGVVNPLNLASLTYSFSANSAYTITTPAGYDGIKKVDVNVDVNSGAVINNQFKAVSISANGETIVNYDTGFTGLENVRINTNVRYNGQNKAISATTNGTYTIRPDSGYEGLNKADIYVNIEQTGHTEQELRQAYDSGITFQKSKLVSTAITTNGIYTKNDGYSAVTVNIDIVTPYQNGYSSGYTDGLTSGKTIGYTSGYTIGYTSGKTDGYNSGYTIGYESGYTDGTNTQKSKLIATNITQNGTYTREDGYSSVTVNVPSTNVVSLTQAQYDALTEKDNNTIYLIKG